MCAHARSFSFTSVISFAHEKVGVLRTAVFLVIDAIAVHAFYPAVELIVTDVTIQVAELIAMLTHILK